MSKLKTTTNPVDVAYFRFGIIAPVIQGTYSDASESAYYRRVTATPFILPDGSSCQYSPDTLQRWTSKYRNSGMDGLMPKNRKDKGKSRTIDETAEVEIERFLLEFPHANGVGIHDHLVRDGFIDTSVSVRAVQRFLQKRDMHKPREVILKERHAFEMDMFGKLWQADTAFLPSITLEGESKSRRTCVVMIIDDHSRMIVGGEIFFHDNALNFQKVLKDAIEAFGIPDKLVSDNGGPYRNSQLSFILGNVGIRESHPAVRDAAAKGKVLCEGFYYPHLF